MTEYEYASLFAAFLEASNAVFANFMAIVFAMLTASFFLASRLTRTMSAMLLGIYSLWMLNLISGVYGAFGDFSGLGLKIHEVGMRPGADLDWLGPVAAGDAVVYLKIMPEMMLGMSLAVYVVSIAFFFVSRRHGFGLGPSPGPRASAGDADAEAQPRT